MVSCCVGLASSAVFVDSGVMLLGVVVVDSGVMLRGSGIKCSCC